MFTNITILKSGCFVHSVFLLTCCWTKKTYSTKTSLVKLVLLVNKTLKKLKLFVNHSERIFYYVIKPSNNYVSNLQKLSRCYYQSLYSHFWCAKALLLRRKVWKIDKLNYSVQNCFERFVDNFVEIFRWYTVLMHPVFLVRLYSCWNLQIFVPLGTWVLGCLTFRNSCFKLATALQVLTLRFRFFCV